MVAHNQAIFKNNLYQILEDHGVVSRLSEDSILEICWNEFRESHPFKRKSYKINLNRFMSLVTEGGKEALFLTERRIVYENVCIELDLLNKDHFEVTHVKPETTASSSTTPKQMDCLDRAIRSKC